MYIRPKKKCTSDLQLQTIRPTKSIHPTYKKRVHPTYLIGDHIRPTKRVHPTYKSEHPTYQKEYIRPIKKSTSDLTLGLVPISPPTPNPEPAVLTSPLTANPEPVFSLSSNPDPDSVSPPSSNSEQ